MSLESNKAAVRQFLEAINQRRAELLTGIATPEVVQEWTDAIPSIHRDMKGHHMDVLDSVAEGDLVAVRLATRGSHTGEMHGLPPTGKAWTNRVFDFFKFEGGKISQVDALPDAENIIKQIGGKIVAVPT